MGTIPDIMIGRNEGYVNVKWRRIILQNFAFSLSGELQPKNNIE